MMHLHLIKVCSLIYRTLSQLRFLLYLRALAPIFFGHSAIFMYFCAEKKFLSSYTGRICIFDFPCIYNGSGTFFFWYSANFVEKVKYKSSSSHIPHEFAFSIFVTYKGFFVDFFQTFCNFGRKKLFPSYTTR